MIGGPTEIRTRNLKGANLAFSHLELQAHMWNPYRGPFVGLDTEA